MKENNMSRRLIIYPIILISLFLLIVTSSVLAELSRLPGIVVVQLMYRPSTLLALAGTLALVGFFVGIRALRRYNLEIKEDLFP
jgi:tetrahydromethanopterin S-methyltransferase subunit C